MTAKWYDRADALLKERGISRVRVGQALGQTPQSASLKLSGQRPASVDEIAVIAGLIGVSAAELIAGDMEFITSLEELEFLKLLRMLTPDQKALILNTMRTFIGATVNQ